MKYQIRLDITVEAKSEQDALRRIFSNDETCLGLNQWELDFLGFVESHLVEIEEVIES